MATSDEGTRGNAGDNERFVRGFLRGGNLEQLGRTEEAMILYEEAIAASFDSSGPYDRLISIYLERHDHEAVIRVAKAAVRSLRTYPLKRSWYEDAARKAQSLLEGTSES